VLEQELTSRCSVEECFHPVIDLVGLAMSLCGELWANEIELELKLRKEVRQFFEVVGRAEETLLRLRRATHHHYSDLRVLPETHDFDQIDKCHRECQAIKLVWLYFDFIVFRGTFESGHRV